MKIFKGDTIIVLLGKDKGRKGVVERLYTKQNTVVVPGINMFKKHVKKSEQMPQGGVVSVPRSLAVNKVMLVCPTCKKPTRVGYKKTGKKKVRICKKCSEVIKVTHKK